MRKELEYDEGLAGQIYRASEPSEIFTSVLKQILKTFQTCRRQQKCMLRFPVMLAYNPSEGKAVQILQS